MVNPEETHRAMGVNWAEHSLAASEQPVNQSVDWSLVDFNNLAANQVVYMLPFMDRVLIELVLGNLCRESSDMIVCLNDGFLLNASFQARELTGTLGP